MKPDFRKFNRKNNLEIDGNKKQDYIGLFNEIKELNFSQEKLKNF